VFASNSTLPGSRQKSDFVQNEIVGDGSEVQFKEKVCAAFDAFPGATRLHGRGREERDIQKVTAFCFPLQQSI
jgi:hypothetical protein